MTSRPAWLTLDRPSLFAVGTSENRHVGGQIYVFGQKRVSCTFSLPRKASVSILRFVGDKVVCADTKHDLSVFSLETTRIITSYAPPCGIATLTTDPLLDYVLVGLQNGEIVAYDLDRHCVAPLKIQHLLREQNPRARLSPVTALCFHPRDIGTLLVAYPEGVSIFSFQQNKCIKTLSLPSSPVRLTHALWHPTGTFIVVAYEDGSLIFWDVKDGRQIASRRYCQESVDRRSKLSNIAWCVKDNPDDTSLLFASGNSAKFHFIDLGLTPVYATSSWQAIAEYFNKPKTEHDLLIPPNTSVLDFVLIPAASPHFAGACKPIAIVAVLSSGELFTLTFPSGHPISPTNQLHVSLSFVHPFIDRFSVAYIDRTQWLGMMESRTHGPRWLKGGAESRRSMMRFSRRNILCLAHADGIVRLWDAGHGDEVENGDAVQIDIARAVERYQDIEVVTMAASCVTGEVVVGLKTGEVVIFRWAKNANYGKDLPHKSAYALGLENIVDRAETSVKEGLMPFALYRGRGTVTQLQVCDVGFVAAAFQDGSLVVIDLRGPAVIYDKMDHKRGNKRVEPDAVTAMIFSVMSLENEDYSSILLVCGTSLGRLLTFRLLPAAGGTYTVESVGSVELEGSVIALSSMRADTGEAAEASQEAVASLRLGTAVDGVLIVSTTVGARTYRLPSTKGASKSWENVTCHAAAVVRFEAHTYALVGIFADGTTRAYSIPGFKEIGNASLSQRLDLRRLAEAAITPVGQIIGWSGPSELVMLNVWGSGEDLTRSLDKIYNSGAAMPARPTISNLQWMAGTSHVSATDVDNLIGGPDRPPSKRMIEQIRAEEYANRLASRQNTGSSGSSSKPASAQEGYWSYMQRQVQERTEQLGLTGDSMERLEDNSEGFANDINKFIKNQKKAAVKGFISSKLGF